MNTLDWVEIRSAYFPEQHQRIIRLLEQKGPAAGVAVLLALAESSALADLPLTLEWILVNGEENGS